MIVGSKVRLRAKRLSDAQADYAWQMDPELVQLDAASPITTPFRQYLSDYFSELYYPSLTRRHFAIETLDGRHIGNCSYYGINEAKGDTELGIVIGDRSYWDKGYGADAVSALLSHIFRHTKLTRIYLKTLGWNIRAHKCFQKCGFTPCGNFSRDGFCFVLMEIYRRQWEENQANFPETEQ